MNPRQGNSAADHVNANGRQKDTPQSLRHKTCPDNLSIMRRWLKSLLRARSFRHRGHLGWSCVFEKQTCEYAQQSRNLRGRVDLNMR